MFTNKTGKLNTHMYERVCTRVCACVRTHVCVCTCVLLISTLWLSRNLLKEGAAHCHTHSTMLRQLANTSDITPNAVLLSSTLTAAISRFVFSTRALPVLGAITIIVAKESGSSPFIATLLHSTVFIVQFFIFILRQAIWCFGLCLIRIIRRVLWWLKPEKSDLATRQAHFRWWQLQTNKCRWPKQLKTDTWIRTKWLQTKLVTEMRQLKTDNHKLEWDDYKSDKNLRKRLKLDKHRWRQLRPDNASGTDNWDHTMLQTLTNETRQCIRHRQLRPDNASGTDSRSKTTHTRGRQLKPDEHDSGWVKSIQHIRLRWL